MFKVYAWATLISRTITVRGALSHRVGRVLSFFSSRRNWDSPNPSPAGECAPPGSGGGAHSREGMGVWESPYSDERTYTVVLCKYTYFVPYPQEVPRVAIAPIFQGRSCKYCSAVWRSYVVSAPASCKVGQRFDS
jgi:hypothetical protein